MVDISLSPNFLGHVDTNNAWQTHKQHESLWNLGHSSHSSNFQDPFSLYNFRNYSLVLALLSFCNLNLSLTTLFDWWRCLGYSSLNQQGISRNLKIYLVILNKDNNRKKLHSPNQIPCLLAIVLLVWGLFVCLTPTLSLWAWFRAVRSLMAFEKSHLNLNLWSGYCVGAHCEEWGYASIKRFCWSTCLPKVTLRTRSCHVLQ